MEAVLKSFLIVAATEMGDKTQLLALVLATRFKKPGAVMLGILTATIFNHLLAAIFGSWVSDRFSPEILKWVLAISFFAFSIWVLIPDKDDGKTTDGKFGAFFTTLIVFFLAEMGDKTQLATVAMAAQFKDVGMVTIGTTLGMMFSDGLAVLLGEKLTQRISMKRIRYFSALLFLIFGIWVLVY